MSKIAAAAVLTLFFMQGNADGALASSAPKIVGLGPDLITVLTTPPVRDKKAGVFEGAELQGEVTSESAAAANGWRSMRATFDVSCSDRSDRVRTMTVFSEHNGKGQMTVLTPPAGWIAPRQNTSYGLGVVKFFCGEGLAKPGTRPGSTEDAPPAAASAVAAAPSYGLASSRPAASGSAVVLTPTGPDAVTTNETEPAARADSGPQGGGPLAPTPVAPPGARTSKSTGLGSSAVQVGSTTTEAEAVAILERLKAAHAAAFGDLQTRIEPADVQGQRRYRAIVSGFSDAKGAASFCTALHAPNGCFVRRGP